MFFRKKQPVSLPKTKPKGPRLGVGNRRKHYRVRPKAGHPLRASLGHAWGRPCDGECIDLSIGGAWVRFDAARNPRLKVNDICPLRIWTPAYREAVTATCRVVAILPLDKRWIRVGFQFTDPIELYAQLDEYYASLFNRRRHLRVRSDFDLRIPVQLAWYGGSLSAVAIDISEGGLGILLPLDKAKVLERVSEVEVTFRLPGEQADMTCRASIRSRSRAGNSCLVGLGFSRDGGIRDHRAAVQRCVEKRLAAFRVRNARHEQRTRIKPAS